VTLLADVVAVSEAVAATGSRSQKTAALAELLRRLEPGEVAICVSFLSGAPRQGRIGVGYAALAGVERAERAGGPLQPTLTVADVDRAVSELGAATGSGSAGQRATLLRGVLQRATAGEARFLTALLTGGLRQGALAGVMADAVAEAAGVPGAAVRRAQMLTGDLGRVAELALSGGEPALRAVGLTVFAPVLPMLASTSAGVAEAIEGFERASVEWKLDGIRVQIHRDGDLVRVYTRNLNEITAAVPGLVAAALALPVRSAVLDGEALWMDGERPARFQDTVSQLDGDGTPDGIVTFLFDVLHVDGVDLLDAPLAERLARLQAIAGPLKIPGTLTSDVAEAQAVAEAALAAGHEGVVIKDASSTYAAGRRGKTWRKVKPVHTYDLVVLGAEWGHGRRRGWLSNLHLGAREQATGAFVMVGKTFKGLTDELLSWQTEALQRLEVERRGIAVLVRPELVVEIALDGVQRSTRYPGGIALRFARVKRYRPDKDASEADTLDALRALGGLEPRGDRAAPAVER
jgi:ATP-dependent DNA ligase I